LAGSVPNLQFYLFAVHLEGAGLEVYPNCGNIVLLESFSYEREDEIGLADSAVPDYYQFGKDVHALFRLHYIFYLTMGVFTKRNDGWTANGLFRGTYGIMNGLFYFLMIFLMC